MHTEARRKSARNFDGTSRVRDAKNPPRSFTQTHFHPPSALGNLTQAFFSPSLCCGIVWLVRRHDDDALFREHSPGYRKQFQFEKFKYPPPWTIHRHRYPGAPKQENSERLRETERERERERDELGWLRVKRQDRKPDTGTDGDSRV